MDPTGATPMLPWHGSADAWRQLRDHLPELENLRHLSIWLDPSSQYARWDLLHMPDLLRFDRRLLPFLRVSVPLSQEEDGSYRPVRNLPPHDCEIVARGEPSWFQKARLSKPTFSPAYIYPRMVMHWGDWTNVYGGVACALFGAPFWRRDRAIRRFNKHKESEMDADALNGYN